MPAEQIPEQQENSSPAPEKLTLSQDAISGTKTPEKTPPNTLHSSDMDRIVFFNASPQNGTAPNPTQVDPTPKRNTPAFVQSVNSFIKSHKKIVIGGAIIAPLFIVGSAFAFSFYAKHLKYGVATPAESLLPDNPNIVISVTNDLQAEPFQQLEKHFQKFPGYDTIQKDLSSDGKAKTVSQSLQEKFASYHIDFDKDIRPTLDSKTIIVVEDITPLKKTLQSNPIIESSSSLLSKLFPAQTHQEQEPILALNDIDIPSVLGKASEKSRATQSILNASDFDFIAITPILDVATFQKISEQILQEKSLTVTPKSSDGYEYSEIEQKTEDLKFYSGVVGKNFVITSTESAFQKVIQRNEKQHSLPFATKPDIAALSENNEYTTVSTTVPEEKNQLLSIYVNIDPKKFLQDDCKASSTNCANTDEYFQSSKNTILNFRIYTDDDGIGISAVSNSTDLEGVKNIPLGTTSAKEVPQQLNGLWTDAFVENANIKERYYQFKKNNLTQKGNDALGLLIKQIGASSGIDLEKDFIDQINGKSQVLLLTNKQKKPEIIFTVPIVNSEKMRSSVESFFLALKNFQMETLQLSIATQENSLSGKPSDFQLKYGIKPFPLTPAQKAEITKKLDTTKKQLSALQKMSLETTETSAGKIFSMPISNDFGISLNFSVENNHLTIGTSKEITEAMLKSSGTNIQSSLADNTYYQQTQKHAFQEGISQEFIVPQGIVNAIGYFITTYLASEMPSAAVTQTQIDDATAIIRTIKALQASQSVDGQFVRSNLYFNIKELPAGEKARSEQFWKTMSGSTTSTMR